MAVTRVVDSDRLKKICEGMVAKQEKPVTLDDLAKRSIVNATESMYDKGTVLFFPDDATGRLGMEEFKSTIPGGESTFAPFIWVNTEKHGPKKVFLSQFARTVMPYVEKDGEIVQEGDPICGDSKLYNDARGCHDYKEVLDLVLGKTVVVYDVKPGKTARYRDREIVGIRKVNVPCFKYEEEQ